jgi:hypothetical protein
MTKNVDKGGRIRTFYLLLSTFLEIGAEYVEHSGTLSNYRKSIRSIPNHQFEILEKGPLSFSALSFLLSFEFSHSLCWPVQIYNLKVGWYPRSIALITLIEKGGDGNSS